MATPSVRPRRGFTLVEWLVVAAAVAAAAGLALPAVQKVREAANRSRCQDRLRRIGAGLLGTHDAYGWFPPAGTGATAPGESPAEWTFPPGASPDSTPATRGSHFYYLLPAVDQAAVYQLMRSRGGGYTPDHRLAPPGLFLCPSDPTPRSAADRHFGNFAANVQLFGQGGLPRTPTFRRLTKPAKVADGLSNTVAYAERSRVCPEADGSVGRTVWTGFGVGMADPTFAWELDPIADRPPGNAGVSLPQFGVALARCDPSTTQTYHPGAMNVGLADGSVRPVGASVSVRAWQLAVVPDDGAKSLGW